MLALIGLVGGLLAGMFGIGGGIIMVPAFIIFAQLSPKLASGTSLAAIIPTAAVGSISYTVAGHVDWLAAAVLAVGAAAGAQIGTYLMSRISTGLLLSIFVTLQATLMVSLWVVVPQREVLVTWNLGLLALVLVLGTVTGILAGLLGVGGGLIVVPALIALFGESDVVAKGTSLVMMIPGAISGTIANVKRGFVDVRAALIAGVVAAAVTPLGALIAHAIDPRLGNILLSLLILFAAVRMVRDYLRRRREVQR